MIKKVLKRIFEILKWIITRILIVLGICMATALWGYYYTKRNPPKPNNQRGKKFWYFDGELAGKKAKRFRRRG